VGGWGIKNEKVCDKKQIIRNLHWDDFFFKITKRKFMQKNVAVGPKTNKTNYIKRFLKMYLV
jgi:hypothetical protein